MRRVCFGTRRTMPAQGGVKILCISFSPVSICPTEESTTSPPSHPSSLDRSLTTRLLSSLWEQLMALRAWRWARLSLPSFDGARFDSETTPLRNRGLS